MLTRRAALKGGTAVATCAAVTTVAGAGAVTARMTVDDPDAYFIAWEAEMHALYGVFDEGGMPEEEAQASFTRIVELEHHIAETEARTERGLAVKFRRLVNDWEVGDGAWTTHNIRTLLSSLELLAGEAQS